MKKPNSNTPESAPCPQSDSERLLRCHCHLLLLLLRLLLMRPLTGVTACLLLQRQLA
jgi:hypothetical protein